MWRGGISILDWSIKKDREMGDREMGKEQWGGKGMGKDKDGEIG